LPETIVHADAAANTTRGELLVHALASRPDLLFIATEDFIHQKFRQEAMPKSFALLNKLRGAGVAAFISGAGPTVLAFHNGDPNEIAELERAAGSHFEVKPLSICTTGAAIIA
jgi:homoserine kinase